MVRFPVRGSRIFLRSESVLAQASVKEDSFRTMLGGSCLGPRWWDASGNECSSSYQGSRVPLLRRFVPRARRPS